MSRRPVVLLTPPHSISNSLLLLALSLEGCTFCTLLQKSGAHPLTFQLLPRSLQKPQVSPKASFKFRRFCPLHGSWNTLHASRLLNSFIRNTYSRSPRFSRNQPKSSSRNPFRCNTYRLRACNSFIRNTYKKQGVGGAAYLIFSNTTPVAAPVLPSSFILESPVPASYSASPFLATHLSPGIQCPRFRRCLSIVGGCDG
jgi:hypothetical protein